MTIIIITTTITAITINNNINNNFFPFEVYCTKAVHCILRI